MATESNGLLGPSNATKMLEPAYIFFDGFQRSLKASRRIRQGETIVVLPQSSIPGPDQYSLEIYPGIHVDCSDSKAGAINHSCDPNAFVKENRVVAWKCILPGDEITLDYKATEQNLAVPFECACGYKGCRGRIE
jgi:hypothetical protein